MTQVFNLKLFKQSREKICIFYSGIDLIVSFELMQLVEICDKPNRYYSKERQTLIKVNSIITAKCEDQVFKQVAYLHCH